MADMTVVFQSTCPVRGTTCQVCRGPSVVAISIHVPRTGHDEERVAAHVGRQKFQSTCPVRGTTLEQYAETLAFGSFQSTCPVRGTTLKIFAEVLGVSDFNPRAPYGARRRSRPDRAYHLRDFNPRAPYGARRWRDMCRTRRRLFQSTCPVRGTTLAQLESGMVESEFQSTCPVRGTTYFHDYIYGKADFNPRAPYGARRASSYNAVDPYTFQSTCPVRGTTPT